jgi:GT2 family glycosyltransferase
VSRAVTAVVPNRDGAGLVGRCVEAALAAGAAEVVVVDDGSTDDSPAEAAAAGARVARSAGRGFAAAVNHGARLARHQLLLVVNSDCFVEPTALGYLVDAVVADPSLALCGASLRSRDGLPERSHGRETTLGLAIRNTLSPPAPLRGSDSGVQNAPFVPLTCALARRPAWESVGGLDERYRFYYEDYDLCWRLQEGRWRVAVCWDARAVHLGGGSSSAGDPQSWFRQHNESRALYLRKRYPRGWLLYAAVWVPVALARALTWLPRRRPEGRRWARAYAASALAGLGRRSTP